MKCTPVDNHHLLSFQRGLLTPRRQQAWTPALIKHLSPPPHPGWPHSPFFSSWAPWSVTMKQSLTCILVCTPPAVKLTRKIQPSTFPTFAFAPLCWENQQYSLPTHVWEPEVGPERAACHHTTHSCPATLPFSSTPTSQLLWPQYPYNSSPPHSWLRILPTSQRTEEIEENPTGSYPRISPPVSAAGTCSASGLYISEEIPTTRRLTCSILNSQPVPWIRPTRLLKDIPPEPPPTLLERSRQLTDTPVFSSLKKKYTWKPSIDFLSPSRHHPFPPLPTAIKFFCILQFLSPLSVFSHFIQPFVPNRLPLTRSPATSMLLNRMVSAFSVVLWSIQSPARLGPHPPSLPHFLGLPGYLPTLLVLLSLLCCIPRSPNTKLAQSRSLVLSFSPSKLTA